MGNAAVDRDWSNRLFMLHWTPELEEESFRTQIGSIWHVWVEIASARDPRSPPSARRSSALRQVTEADTGRSLAVGLAVRRLERVSVQHLYHQSFDCHRLAPKRLSAVLGLEGPTR